MPRAPQAPWTSCPVGSAVVRGLRCAHLESRPSLNPSLTQAPCYSVSATYLRGDSALPLILALVVIVLKHEDDL